MTEFPRLRPLDIRPFQHDGAPYVLLRDPQQLSERQLLVPQPLAAVLAFCDGQHDVPAMVEAFRRRYEIPLSDEIVEELVAALDEALMLENVRTAERRAAALRAFRAAPFRPPALAESGYPGERQALWRLLQDYLEEADGVEPRAVQWSQPIGLLSPHIDYARGNRVYAHLWKRAATAAREAELVIMIGTDHYGSDLFTLTRQNYATPYGVLPTATPIVDELAALLGSETAFNGELRHRNEHSLELVAVWLHHMRAGTPVPLVPILAGSYHRYMDNGARPTDESVVAAVIDTLRKAAAGKRTLVVASGDLAHVGPAFGGKALDESDRRALQKADGELIAAMRSGDGDLFFDAISRIRDRNNVCGVAPIYLTMKTLGACRGEQAGYAVCPADTANTSVVTVTGMFFNGA
ncbi:MAG: AmmeMemoRadiSam system protein B [Caldilineaceae bacterium]|nr:AmmeMemoRadiSam system protein B [Caldilineaceae bacterium]